jgi:hypothetical protein
MDQALINELMGESCQRIQSIAKDDHCCTYRVAGPVDLEFPLHELKDGETSHANISLVGIDGISA